VPQDWTAHLAPIGPACPSQKFGTVEGKAMIEFLGATASSHMDG